MLDRTLTTLLNMYLLWLVLAKIGIYSGNTTLKISHMVVVHPLDLDEK